jgi:hypothetical protein
MKYSSLVPVTPILWYTRPGGSSEIKKARFPFHRRERAFFKWEIPVLAILKN